VKEGLHALADRWRSLAHVAESVWNDWQVGVLLIGASVGWHFTADRTHPLAKVLSRAFGNAAMGLAFVLLLLLAVNLVDPSGHQDTLSRVDRFLLAVHEALPRWLKVPWLALPLMLVLAALTVAFPQWRLVSRFVRAHRDTGPKGPAQRPLAEDVDQGATGGRLPIHGRAFSSWAPSARMVPSSP